MLLRLIAINTLIMFPTQMGNRRKLNPKLVTLSGPEMNMRETAPAGGWETPKNCMALIAQAGACGAGMRARLHAMIFISALAT